MLVSLAWHLPSPLTETKKEKWFGNYPGLVQLNTSPFRLHPLAVSRGTTLFGSTLITHTYQEQVRGLERASRNELISEFSAIRAGQRADPQLRGIKAQSLRPQENSALPDSTESKSEPPSTSTDVTSPDRPPCAQPQHSLNGSNTASDGRCSRVSENFSRPVSKTSFSPISPPKRISSLNAFNSVIGVSQDAFNAKGDTHSSGAYSQQISRPAMNPASSPVSFILPSRDRDNIAVGHAISTADDSARHLKTSPLPMLPVDLDDVPEDEEGFIHSETDTSPVECGNRSLALRHAQSFPSIRPDAIQNDSVTAKASDVQRHTTSLDEGHARLSLDDGTSNWSDAPHHQPRRDTKRFSVGLKPMCETEHWEEDVDYCYEHAAEAESDFDWDQQVANFPVGLLPSVFDSSDPVEQSLTHLQKLAGLRKHDSQESSVLSIASSIADISASTNSVASLPELAYSVNSSRESMDWEINHGNKRHSKPARRSQPASPAKSVKPRQGLGLSYSLFPSTPTPPRTP
jgi:hypothetical protein